MNEDNDQRVNYVIPDEKEISVQQPFISQNLSTIIILMIALLIIIVPLSIVFYDSFSKSHTLETMSGWYEGKMTFETTENDPEGYYDKYPQYLVAGQIPIIFRLESIGGAEGKLTVIDRTSMSVNMEYRIWFEEGKLIGEPYDLERDIKTRLDFYGDVVSNGKAIELKGAVGIKDMENDAVVVFHFQADRKERDLNENYLATKTAFRQFDPSTSFPDLTGLWFDMTPASDVRFVLINGGSVIDPESSVRVEYNQPDFMMLYLDDEYEVVPFVFNGKDVSGKAEYIILDNGKIFITSEEGSYLVDESIFEGENLIKVKLGDIDLNQIVKRMYIEVNGGLKYENQMGYLYLEVKIKGSADDSDMIREHELMLQYVDL